MISKKLIRIVAVILCCVLVCGCTPANNSVNAEQELSANTRSVAVAATTYEDQINYIIDKFDTYTTDSDEVSVSFEGSLTTGLSSVDFVADTDINTEKKVKARYNYETNEFYVEIQLLRDGVIVETVEQSATPLYDEELDEGYLEIDGERYYFSECFDADNIDDCAVAITASAGVAAIGILAICAITIAVTPPSVHQQFIQNVQQLKVTFTENIKSFFGWFTRWVKKTVTRIITKTTTTVVTNYTPAIEINGKRVETKVVTVAELKKYPSGRFYLCFVNNEQIYISPMITEETAIAILLSGTVVKDKNTGKDMLASTYTLLQNDAYRVAVAAGLSERTPNYTRFEGGHGGKHYHCGPKRVVNGEEHYPHSFFIN